MSGVVSLILGAAGNLAMAGAFFAALAAIVSVSLPPLSKRIRLSSYTENRHRETWVLIDPRRMTMGFNAGKPPVVPEDEIDISFARSSGPGGQNVNKTSTKAQLRWRVGDSAVFTDGQKSAIRKIAGHRLNAQDEVALSAESERSQLQNKETAIARLQALVAEALAPKKMRRPTKVSRAQRRKRLDDKGRLADKKRARKPPKGD